MGLRAKAAAAAAAGGLSFGLIGASPADAGELAQATKDFTFTFQGQSITCTVRGYSQVSFVDGRTYIEFATEHVDADSACKSAVRLVNAGVDYWREEGSLSEFALATGRGVAVGSIGVDGPIIDAAAIHSANFACDTDTRLGCSFTFGTDPK